MKKSTLALPLIALFLSSSSIIAQENTENAEAERAKNHEKERHGKRQMKHKRMHEYMLMRVDSNEDGKVDLNEYLANAEQRFQNMDSNKDGFVTMEEHKEAGKAMREKHREMRKKMREEHRAERAVQQEADGS